MSLTASDSDSFLDILNDSLKESDIRNASNSLFKRVTRFILSTLSSENKTEEVMHERSDLWISKDHYKQEPSKNVRTRANNMYPGRQGPRSAARHAKTLLKYGRYLSPKILLMSLPSHFKLFKF
ncbi:hypothetical protein T4D_238 [Trichinella pseudospiralis]|uniref:Uncharacterized protein n=1 Tax=Trichinella pseudospiralis TaxID=6337 RepID=A0A0V1FZR9_TRIPS|nr:hypothetical protein T4D_238 [Trichinella pseudospiralis]